MNELLSKGIERQGGRFYRRNVKELAAVEHRIDAFCHWFDCEHPKLSYDKAGVLNLDDGIVDWCHDQGASIDWIICGDPLGIAATFRNSCETLRPIKEDLDALNPEELRTIEISMKAYIKGIAPLEQTIEAAQNALREIKEEAA